MKPDRLPSSDAIRQLMERLRHEPMDPELFVLKCHLLVERNLYWLLSARLGIDEVHLPPLQFYPLAKLALGGEKYKITLVNILALNDVRNEFGHELGPKLEVVVDKLCRLVGVFCPESSGPSDSDAIRLRATGLRIAAFGCAQEVWMRMAELSLEMGLYENDEDASGAEQALSEARRFRSNLPGQQADVAKEWGTFRSLGPAV